MEHVGNFMAIWSILRPFGLFYDHLVYFTAIWYVVPRKIWHPCPFWHKISQLPNTEVTSSLLEFSRRSKVKNFATRFAHFVTL
jgi:hypothetical protein